MVLPGFREVPVWQVLRVQPVRLGLVILQVRREQVALHKIQEVPGDLVALAPVAVQAVMEETAVHTKASMKGMAKMAQQVRREVLVDQVSPTPI